MEIGLASYGVGFLAGLLSTLSPCVLPLVPVLLGSATSVHRRAPLALAGGLAISYATIGTSLAWAGTALNFDAGVLRYVGAMVLALLGVVLMSGNLQQRFAVATSGVGDAGQNLISRLQPDGMWGQFVVGLVLGVVWSPCAGPTLGTAVMLASQGSHLLRVTLLMGIFGLGAALPVVALTYVSRGAMAKMRGKLLQAGKTGKISMGVIMVAIAGLILTGIDKVVEASLVAHSPAWLSALTTRF